MLNKDVISNLKNLLKSILILVFVGAVLWFLVYKPLTREKYVFPPIVKVNDTLYLTTGTITEDQVPEGFVEVGKITSVISHFKVPEKNFETNYDFADKGIIYVNEEEPSTIYIKYHSTSAVKGIELWKTEAAKDKELEEINKAKENGN